MSGKNYYETLGLSRTATDFEIKNAYRRLALKFHPQQDKANEGQFRQIAEAYTVLIDPVKRAKFDQYGEEGLKNGVLEQTEYRGFQYVGDPMKLFYDFFGETSPFSIMVEENSSKFNLVPRTIHREAGSDCIDVELRCTLEELHSGAIKAVKVERQRFDAHNRSYVDSKVLTIKIEKGWKAGMKLRFRGEGNQLAPNTTGDSKPGDILFTVVEDQHATFERILDTYDLLYIHRCSLSEALCGHIISIGLLDETTLNLHVSETVSPGYEKRILQHGTSASPVTINGQPTKECDFFVLSKSTLVIHGVPSPTLSIAGLLKPDGTFGDLVIRWDIQFPVLSADEKAAMKKIIGNK